MHSTMQQTNSIRSTNELDEMWTEYVERLFVKELSER